MESDIQDEARINEFKENLIDANPEAMLCDGLDFALIGVARRKMSDPLAAYSVKKILDAYMNEGMEYEEAREYFEFNVVDALVGSGTPVFVEDEEWDE